MKPIKQPQTQAEYVEHIQAIQTRSKAHFKPLPETRILGFDKSKFRILAKKTGTNSTRTEKLSFDLFDAVSYLGKNGKYHDAIAYRNNKHSILTLEEI